LPSANKLVDPRISPRNARIRTTKHVARKLLTFELVASSDVPQGMQKTEDAKESIHSMRDMDSYAWGSVEIKINGSEAGIIVRGK